MTYITSDTYSHNITNASQGVSFEFTSEGTIGEWVVDSMSPWLTVTEQSGRQGTLTIRVQAEANNTGVERTGSVVVYDYDEDENEKSYTVYVIQSWNDVSNIGYINDDRKTVGYQEQRNMTVLFNVSDIDGAYTVTYNVPWIYVIYGKFGNKQYIVMANDTDDSRVADLIATGTDTAGHTVMGRMTIEQSSYVAAPVLYFAATEVKLGEGAGGTLNHLELPFIARNISEPAVTQTGDEWFHLGSGSGELSEKKIYYSYDANNGPERTATVTLTANALDGSGPVSTTVTFVQDKKSGYIEPKGEFQINEVIAPAKASSGTTDYLVQDMREDTLVLLKLSLQSWCSARLNKASRVIEWSVTENLDDGANRTAYFQVTGQNTDGIMKEFIISITQSQGVAVVRFPVWMDTEVDLPLSEGGYTDYEVQVAGSTIHSGRAYTIDGQCKVLVNKLLEDQMIETLDLNRVGGIQDNKGLVTASLLVGGQELFKLQTWNDWTYVNDELVQNVSDPVRRVYDSRQYLPYSFINDGIHSDYIATALVDKLGNETVREYTVDSALSTVLIPCAPYNKITFRTVSGNVEFVASEKCYEYCLYYRNKKGGYESFLFNSASLQTDQLTNVQYLSKTSNLIPRHQIKLLRRDVVETWNLKSDYLSDEEARRFIDLIESPDCYLHNLGENRIIPVNVTSSTAAHLQRSNNRRKRVRFDITVEGSINKKIR